MGAESETLDSLQSRRTQVLFSLLTIEQLAPILLQRDPRGGKLGLRVDDFTTFSTRPAHPGSPVNYYDEKWYKKLSSLEKRLLRPKPAMNLTLPQWVQT